MPAKTAAAVVDARFPPSNRYRSLVRSRSVFPRFPRAVHPRATRERWNNNFEPWRRDGDDREHRVALEIDQLVIIGSFVTFAAATLKLLLGTKHM